MFLFDRKQYIAIWVLFFVVVGVLAKVPVANVPNPPKTSGSLLALWTQFVVGNHPTASSPALEVRFVLMGKKAQCDGVIVQGIASGKKVLTRGMLQGSFRKQVSQSDNSNASATAYQRGSPYWVQVCSAPLDPSATKVTLTRDQSVLEVYPDNAAAIVPGPARLGHADGTGKTISAVVLGDSGCRGKTGPKGSRYYQDCNLTGIARDEAFSWPFKSLADKAVSLNPDLVLHVGDYHYFWEDDDFWTGENGRDRFEYWLQEFLLPAQNLLRSAPWALSRGNHERCNPASWFGDGWHTMFAPSQSNCQNPVVASWYLDVAPGNGKTKPYRFVMVDTSNTGLLGQVFNQAVALAPSTGGPMSWVTHYPPLKLVYYSNKAHYGNGSVMNAVNTAMQQCGPGNCQLEAVFAGHQHLYQKLSLSNGESGDLLPSVIIAGNGGTALDQTGLPVGQSSGEFKESVICTQQMVPQAFAVSNISATIKSANRHGLIKLTRGPNNQGDLGWTEEQYWVGSTAPKFSVSAHSCLGGSLSNH